MPYVQTPESLIQALKLLATDVNVPAEHVPHPRSDEGDGATVWY